jgi:hypothetical protein
MTGPWLLAQTGFQAAGFACVTLAAIQGARALLGGTAAPPGAGPALGWTRAGFLLLGCGLAAGALGDGRASWPRTPADHWGLIAWLTFFVVLHVHRVKAFQGRAAICAGLAGWLMALLAFFLLR